jgi:hypothetical protein
MPDSYFGGLGCHNMHVAILGESGLFGGIPYAIFLAAWWIQSFFCRQLTVRAISLGLAFVFCFFGMVSHGILDQRSVNMLLGVVIGLLSLEGYLISKPVVAMMSDLPAPKIVGRVRRR